MLSTGDLIPDLEIMGDDGEPVRTRELPDKHLVLWFYPKDDTPG